MIMIMIMIRSSWQCMSFYDHHHDNNNLRAHRAKGAKGRRATGVAEWSFDHQAKVVKV